ncbi:hypothetical protein C4587_00020 [Candidatus Parcubacteria bacterium]|nr:MAG: hypothetical protein C4587_00020 [Candidatus Parcubacteria bacterium]
MKKEVLVGIGVVIVSALVWGGVFYWNNLRGVGPAISEPAEDISEVINTTGMPLTLPAGFAIEIFAKDLPGARVMAQDSFGNWWVSQTREGIISLLEVQDGKVVRQDPVFLNLKNPHGLAFDPESPFMLYFAEEDKISRVPVYSEGPPEKIADLPSGGGHFTRTIGFGPDGRLYVSIGSSCNVCIEKDDRRAKIFSMNRDGSDFKEFARGLRNAVFFDWSYVDGRMWATENGRDLLGDDIPPDEINIIGSSPADSGQSSVPNFGWPICYGKNIHDTDFDKNTYIRNPCMEPFETPSHIDLQAHSAPLGLAFVPEEGWPEEYWYDLIVAYHGSWNRSEPTGYKLVRIKLDAQGNPPAGGEETEDFITGWLAPGGDALGRPVQVIAQPGGIMYVTDDKAGVIYRVAYGRESTGEPADSVSDLIRVNEPQPDQIIARPVAVSGEARGNWYFEASFPIEILDGDGSQLGIGIAQAQAEWMTTDFVPFRTTIDYKAPKHPNGTIVFRKDNPSGLPEHDAELRVPVRFVSPKVVDPRESGECFVGGCSGQICSDKKDAVSTCEWTPAYACYRTAQCERQADGKCGWTQTPELRSCLERTRSRDFEIELQ